MLKRLDPIHPGEILLEEFMKPGNISPIKLEAMTGISEKEIQEITLGIRDITEDISERLGLALKVSIDLFWRLQKAYNQRK